MGKWWTNGGQVNTAWISQAFTFGSVNFADRTKRVNTGGAERLIDARTDNGKPLNSRYTRARSDCGGPRQSDVGQFWTRGPLSSLLSLFSRAAVPAACQQRRFPRVVCARSLYAAGRGPRRFPAFLTPATRYGSSRLVKVEPIIRNDRIHNKGTREAQPSPRVPDATRCAVPPDRAPPPTQHFTAASEDPSSSC